MIISVNAITGEVSTSDEVSVDYRTPEDIRSQQLLAIQARLTAIDIASVRALRAAAAGSATEADRDQLAVLEAEAAALRSERAGLAAVSPDA